MLPFLRERGDSLRPESPRLPSARLLAALGISLLAAQCLVALFFLGEALGDLAIYRGAVSHAFNGGDLYDYRYEHENRADGYPFTYPPFAAVLLAPLAWLPANITDIMWTVGVAITAIALAVTVESSATTDGSGDISGKEAPSWLRWETVLLALALSYPLLHSVILGEISLLITFLALVDVSGVIPARFRGLLVGVAAAVKLTPLIFIAYFVVTRQRCASWRAIGAFFGAAALGAILMPTESRVYWGTRIFEAGNVGEIWSSGNKAIAGLLARLGLEDLGLLVTWVAVATLVGVVALYRAGIHFREGDNLHAAIVVGCASVAVSPISWAHHQAWAPLAALAILQGQRSRTSALVAGGMLLVFFAFSSTQGLAESGSIAVRIGWELPVLAFVGVSLVGLPRRRMPLPS